ncbi:MAG: hypothetical protein LUI06_02945 [Ruminococcus sp.]|nr:hypothetical protein [Ruminococcus sp.]
MKSNRKYAQKFISRMLIEAGAFSFLINLLLLMQLDKIEISADESILPMFIIVPIICAAAMSVFTSLMAVHNTNLLRRYEYSLRAGRERRFYTAFAIVMIIISTADTVYLLYRLEPFLSSALSYAIKDAYIKNETPSMRQNRLNMLDRRYEGYLLTARISAVMACLLQAAVYIFFTRRLVDIYRNPPDYWSGKGKGRKSNKK